jgi:hypothetical protein
MKKRRKDIVWYILWLNGPYYYIFDICATVLLLYLLWLFTLGKGPDYGKYGPADLSKADFVVDNRMYPHLVSIPYPSSVHW